MAEIHNTPDYKSRAYLEQLPNLTLVNDCYEGSDAVRAKSEYLPQEPGEKAKHYKLRRSLSEFYEFYKQTIDGLVGMAFRKPPVIGSDVPPEIAFHAEDIDRAGNHIKVFSRELLKAALRDGHTSILVDMPPPITERFTNATREDEDIAGIRPSWAHIKKGQIINWRYQVLFGRVVLTQVTIKECIVKPFGNFGEEYQTQYRVLRPGSWELWVAEKVGRKEVVKFQDSGTTALPFIPLVTIYANRTGVLQSKPPLYGLARENLYHYRLRSDYANVMHVCGIPALVAKGRGTNPTVIEISPYSVTDIPADAELKWLEHEGKALPQLEKQIEKSEDYMTSLGLDILSNRPTVAATATETVLDYDRQSNVLGYIVQALQDGIEQALIYHANFLNGNVGGTFQFNKSFSSLNISPQLVQAYNQAVKDGNLTRDTFWKMLAKYDQLPEDFDAITEAQILDTLKQQAPALATAA